MPLEFWITLWKVVLVVGVGLFAVLAVVISIGGARDIVKLLATLRAERADENDETL